MHILRQYLGVEFFNFGFHQFQYINRVFAFSHHDNPLHYIILIIKSGLPYSWHRTLPYVGHIFHQNGISLIAVNDHALDILNRFKQTNSTNDVRLPILLNHIATDVQVTFGDCIVHLTRGKSVNFQFARINIQ